MGAEIHMRMINHVLATFLLLPGVAGGAEISLICTGESWVDNVPASLPEDRWALSLTIYNDDAEKAQWAAHPSYARTNRALTASGLSIGPVIGHFEDEDGSILPFTEVTDRVYEHFVTDDDGRGNILRIRRSLEIDRYDLSFTYARTMGDQYWRTVGVCAERGEPRI